MICGSESEKKIESKGGERERESEKGVCVCVCWESVCWKRVRMMGRERGAEMRCVRIFKRVGGIFKTIERAIHR